MCASAGTAMCRILEWAMSWRVLLLVQCTCVRLLRHQIQ
jgi:hypothetical protein